jgi:16S rRNA (cytidine1402-2'-O)-methyltransferase
VSDAGLPGISDPGARLIRAALAAGVVVSVLPGASAVETALVVSGLVSERYCYVGFLPRRPAERAALWLELAAWRWPVVAFESARRLSASLRSLAEVDPERDVVVCRELTKRFEEVVRGSAAELAARFSDPPKGEITLVVGAGALPSQAVEARAAVADLVGAGTPRRVAADVVARLTDMSRNDLYRSSL